MRNEAVQVFSFTSVAKVLSALTVLLLIRALPKEEFASYTILIALAGFVSGAVASGVNRLYILSLRKASPEIRRGPIFGVQVIVVILACSVLFSFLGLSLLLGLFAAAFGVALVASEYVKTQLQRQQRFQSYGWVELGRSAARFLLVAATVTLGGVWATAASVSLVQVIAILAVALPLMWQLGLYEDALAVRKGLSAAMFLIGGERRYLFIYCVLLALFAKLDVFMLAILSSPLHVATYGSAFQYYTLLLLALSSVHAVLLPAIAKVRSPSELSGVYKKHRQLLLLFIPVVLAAAAAAYVVIPWVDQGRYPQAFTVFAILAVSSVVSFACSPYVHIVMKFERFRVMVLLVMVASLLNATSNAVLIPLYGAVGAAITTLATYGLINIGMFRLAGRLLAQYGMEQPGGEASLVSRFSARGWIE